MAILILLLSGSGCREMEGIEIPTVTSARPPQPTLQPQGSPQSLFPADTATELQEMLKDTVKDERLPGATLYVATSQGNWMIAEGKANLESGVVMKPTDRFRIGEITDLFVAVACLQLVEEGRLKLSDSIVTYLPKEITTQLPNSDRITIRQLLNHTSGLPDIRTDEFLQAVRSEPTREWTAKEMLGYIYNSEPAQRRGMFSKSDSNYLLLGLIIETVTGEPLATGLRQRFYDPLKLSNTFMEVREPIPGGFTQGYQDWNNDGKPENVTKPLVNIGLGLGDRGMVSNAPDLVRFFQALLVEEQLLNPDSLDQMLLTYVGDGKGDTYGFGITNVSTRWGEGMGHRGEVFGFKSAIVYLPVHDLMIVAWMNDGDRHRGNPAEILEDSLHIILGEPE